MPQVKAAEEKTSGPYQGNKDENQRIVRQDAESGTCILHMGYTEKPDLKD